jgi:hypothetical protein
MEPTGSKRMRKWAREAKAVYSMGEGARRRSHE